MGFEAPEVGIWINIVFFLHGENSSPFIFVEQQPQDNRNVSLVMFGLRSLRSSLISSLLGGSSHLLSRL